MAPRAPAGTNRARNGRISYSLLPNAVAANLRQSNCTSKYLAEINRRYLLAVAGQDWLGDAERECWQLLLLSLVQPTAFMVCSSTRTASDAAEAGN